jgi:hypothetical protein
MAKGALTYFCDSRTEGIGTLVRVAIGIDHAQTWVSITKSSFLLL